MTELHEQFARVLKVFVPHESASQVAKQFVEISCPQEDSLPGTFTYCESNTWKLLSIIASENKSTLYRSAKIRQWISEIPTDDSLQNIIKQERQNDIELEEEIESIIKKNRVLSLQQQRPSKIRRREGMDDIKEDVYEATYKQLRSGDYSRMKEEFPTLTYLFNQYIKYSRIAISGETAEINNQERTAWKEFVKHMSKDDALKRYEKALYYTLDGNIKDLCKLEGDTWEDVVWIYLNGRVEHFLDHGDSDDVTIVQDQDLLKTALQKDVLLENNDPRAVFHQIQSALLSNKTKEIIHQFHQGYIKNQWSFTVQDKDNMLRFICALILFGRIYLGWIETPESNALISYYTQQNALVHSFRPRVIAAYTSKLSLHDQTTVFSQFLQHFDGDQEECKILLKLALEHNMNIVDILTTVNRNILTTAPVIPKQRDFQIETPEAAKQYESYFRALHWFYLNDSLTMDLVKSCNKVIRIFLESKNVYLVKQVFERIPQTVYNQVLALSAELGDDKDIQEFDLHRYVMMTFTDYKTWDTLMQQKPEDDGSFDSLDAIYKWRDQVVKQTEHLDNYITLVIESDWAQGSDLRKVYIPEIMFKYHHLLFSTQDFIPRNAKKCSDLHLFITDESNNVFNDIASSSRLPDLMHLLTKSIHC